MPPRLSLGDFVEEELLRAPLTFDAVIDALFEQWRQSITVVGRAGGDLARMLQLQRREFLTAALRTLRLAVTHGAPGASAATARKPVLSLVQEDDVVVDLETGRCAERIKSEAEAELREVHAYTSALVGDFAVARDTNPFRPEHFAIALWDGCQALPAAPAVRLDAFRRAVAPLARGVRISLAAACGRMAAQGVTPATHRTLVFPSMPGGQPTVRPHHPPEDLTTLRDSLAGALDAPSPAPTAPDPAPPERDTAAAAPAGDPQLAQLMRRLYDDIAGDSGLPAEVLALLASLRPAFDRVAIHDEAMVDSFDHPVWKFIDRLAFTVATTPPAERQRLLGLARNLIFHLDTDPALDVSRFAWASTKLAAHDRQSLVLALKAAAPDIHRLMQTPDAVPEPPAVVAIDAEAEPQPLDVHSLDTIPSDLLSAPGSYGDPQGQPPAPLNQGDRLRMFLQGEWRSLQLLWSRSDLQLLRELASGRLWALRPGVIERLSAERLVTPLRMRSLVRRAAERIQQTL